MILSLDCETTGLSHWHGCRPFLIQTMDDSGEITVWRFQVDPFTREVDAPNSDLEKIASKLFSADLIVGHNIKFDLRMIDMLGLELPRSIWDKVQDTMLMSHVVQSKGPHGLKDLALNHLDILDDDETELGEAVKSARGVAKKLGWRIAEPADPHWPHQKTGQSWWKADYWIPGQLAALTECDWEIPPEWSDICETYGKGDVERTLGLYFFFLQRIEEAGLQGQYETRRRNLRVSYEMETRGATFRRFLAPPVRKKHAGLAVTHEKECFKTVNFQIDNLDSNKQLPQAMYNILKFPIIKRTKPSATHPGGQPSTDKDVIAELREHVRPTSKECWFLQHLAGYRKRSHAATTVESWETRCLPIPNKTSEHFKRIHFDFRISGTDTTRYSCDGGQNIAKGEGLPKEEKFNLRDLFGPEPGRLWFTHDYENIELRIFAQAAGETQFIEAFAAGESVHLIVAKELYPEIFCEDFKTRYPHYYQWVKNGNFSLIYGAGEKKADATYHVKGAYRMIRKQFKHIDRFMRFMHDQARREGYVTCLGGYRLEVPHDGPHKAVNYFVQGSAGTAINLAMYRIREYLDTLEDHHMIMTIHDELIHDTPEVHHPGFPYRIKELMEQSGDDLGLALPVDMAKIRISWDQESNIAPEILKFPPRKRA